MFMSDMLQGKGDYFNLCFGHAHLQVMYGLRDKSALQKWSCEDVNFSQLWGNLQQNFNQEKLEEIYVIFVGIYSRRNKAVFEEKFDSPNKVV